MNPIEAEIEKIRSEMIPANKAAEILMVTRNTLYRWEKNGMLMPVKVGGRVLYKLEDVRNFISGEL